MGEAAIASFSAQLDQDVAVKFLKHSTSLLWETCSMRMHLFRYESLHFLTLKVPQQNMAWYLRVNYSYMQLLTPSGRSMSLLSEALMCDLPFVRTAMTDTLRQPIDEPQSPRRCQG